MLFMSATLFINGIIVMSKIEAKKNLRPSGNKWFNVQASASWVLDFYIHPC